MQLFVALIINYNNNNYLYRFTGSVKLKGVVVIGGEDEQHPKELKL